MQVLTTFYYNRRSNNVVTDTVWLKLLWTFSNL